MRIGVIGGGISGIAAAAVLRREGHEVVVFERSNAPGGVWARTYPNVTLQNTAPQYHISDFPWPFEPDLHPTAEQIRRYLAAAIDHFAIDLRLEHEITALDELPEQRGWTVNGTSPKGSFSISFEFVLVAVGQYTQPKAHVDLPGRERYRGQILTEQDVDSPAVFSGKRVAVVGFGKTAVDIAKLASEAGAASVTHVFRTPRWLLPVYLLGLVHASFAMFTRAGSVMMTSWAQPTKAEAFLHSRMRPVVDGFWSSMAEVFWLQQSSAAFGKGAAAKARIARLRPEHPMLRDMRSAAALAPAGFFRAVAEGKIEPVRGELLGFDETGLRVRDPDGHERELPCEQVVLGLGSGSPIFPFMPQRYRAMLEGEPDGVQLYRHLVHPRIPRLAFAGYSHGFLHVPQVEVGTLWLSAMLAGELELPPAEVMEQTIERVRAWKRANVTFEPSRSCAVSTRHQQYLDILMQDLGLSPYRKSNPLAEVFSRYGASDYAGLIDEHQRRRARGPLHRRPVALDS